MKEIDYSAGNDCAERGQKHNQYKIKNSDGRAYSEFFLTAGDAPCRKDNQQSADCIQEDKGITLAPEHPNKRIYQIVAERNTKSGNKPQIKGHCNSKNCVKKERNAERVTEKKYGQKIKDFCDNADDYDFGNGVHKKKYSTKIWLCRYTDNGCEKRGCPRSY